MGSAPQTGYRVKGTTLRAYVRSAYISPVADFEYVFFMCNVNGSISEPQVTGPQSARFNLSW